MNPRVEPPPRRSRALAPATGLLLLLLPSPPPAPGREAVPCPEYWVVGTRACPQVMGSDPLPFLEASRLDAGGCLSRRDPAELIAGSAGRPLIFLVHGSYYKAGPAATEGARIRDDLATLGAIPADSVVVAFDWPSQRTDPNPVKDANEKARRALVAGYHLATFLRRFPAGSRACLVGQSHGGLAVLSSLHLLGGGTLDDESDPCPPSALPGGGATPRLRAVVIASASDRHWLDPGERLDRALAASEGTLCLYNRLDPVLVVHPLGRFSDHRRALGLVGLGRIDEERLGPAMARYRERNIAPLLGPRHTFRGATAIPEIARAIGPYAWAADGAGCLARTPGRRPAAFGTAIASVPEP